MNRQIKKALKSSFFAPDPTRKDDFLLCLPIRRTNGRDFFRNQISYISKSFWICNLLLLGMLILYARSGVYSTYTLLGLACAIPVLSLFGVRELQKSFSCHMDEMEAACRFNLGEITLMRLLITGVFHLLGLGILIAASHSRMDYGILRLSLYLLLPFLANTYLSLMILGHLSFRPGSYASAAVTCLVSIATWILYERHTEILTDRMTVCWMLAAALILTLCIRELIQFRKTLEEHAWNSYSIE